MTKKHSALLMRTYVILVFCFMYLPIAVMIAFSFNESKSRSNFTGFTLGWYKSLFHNEMILSALGLSLVLALVSSIIATVLGTLATLGINSMSRKSQLIINNISYVPVVNPEIITGVSLMLLFVMAQNFGIGGEKTEKVKVSEYIQIIKNNNPMQRLMVAGAGCKLALSIATNTTVLCMLYGCMMGNYDGLYLPMMVLGYVCSVPFFLLTVRTSQKEGQKASLMKYVSVALVCYVGVLVLLLLWGRGDAFTLSILGENGLSINLYTILFIAFFGIGYGAYYATADMPIPMVADCSDYETYRSGKYIPGIMGTLFSLVDKLVSSLSATVVGIAVSFVGLQSLPTQYDPYTPGMNWVVIVLFCIIPMVAWAATLIAMKGYTLTGAKMKEIQAVNACRRDAVAKGMKLEEAMDKWQTMDQLPAEYRS